MKHAYLIVAHNNIRLLNTLIEMLDDQRNDIYLLLDKKAKIKDDEIFQCKKSSLIKLKSTIDIRWGDYTQIEATLYLLREAYKNGEYSYYHLLSGCDLPLKTQDYIHDFFMRHDGCEFVGFVQDSYSEGKNLNQIMKYHFFTKYQKSKYFRTFFRTISKVSELLVNTLIMRKEEIKFKKGCNWFSITNECCGYILSKESFIKKRFKYTLCGDEIFVQSLVYNSYFYDKCFCTTDEYEGCMREIDWSRGNPYTWTIKDKEHLCNSNKLFARKFSEENMDIVLYLKEKIIGCSLSDIKESSN